MKSIEGLVKEILKESQHLELNGSDTDLQTLKRVIEESDTRSIDLQKYVKDPGDKPYGRNVIINTGKVEVVLLTWDKSSICEVHNHGESCGIVKVLKGNISNIIYSIDKDTGVPGHTQEEYVLDDVFFEVPKGCWHQMKNNLDQPSYTLHVYAPPIEEMKVYDKENMRMVQVTDDCGAWLNEPDKYVSIADLRKP